MKRPDRSIDEYRQQIHQCAQALALARNRSVQSFLKPQTLPMQVEMFTCGNLDKRFLKLHDQLEFVAEVFDEREFEDRIAQYIRTVPLAAYDTNCTDGERFLQWLTEKKALTPEQRDFVTCQRSRHAIEFIARKNRLGHVRFQDLRGVTAGRIEELGSDLDLWLHLNPIHLRSTFETSVLLDEESSPPTTVVFFPVENDIRTAVLEEEGEHLLSILQERAPCRIHDLILGLPRLKRSEILETCRDLAEMGLIAVA